MSLQKISLILLGNEKVRIVLSLDTGLEERCKEGRRERSVVRKRVGNQRTSVCEFF